MEHHEERLSHLNRLADELGNGQFVVRLADSTTRPSLRVANREVPQLSERVFCLRAADGSWCFWWPWGQPIGSVDDLQTVAAKVMTVLRPVEGASR
jgi:hypothetical protein